MNEIINRAGIAYADISAFRNLIVTTSWCQTEGCCNLAGVFVHRISDDQTTAELVAHGTAPTAPAAMLQAHTEFVKYMDGARKAQDEVAELEHLWSISHNSEH